MGLGIGNIGNIENIVNVVRDIAEIAALAGNLPLGVAMAGANLLDGKLSATDFINMNTAALDNSGGAGGNAFSSALNAITKSTA